MDQTFYEILNIPKDASNEDIKKAYRKLAIKYHPDKAPDNKKEEYTENFKKISEAYGILSDEEKRNIYDKFGKEAALDNEQNHHHRGGINPFDIFNQFFGNGNMSGGIHHSMFEMGGIHEEFTSHFHNMNKNFSKNKPYPVHHVINITLEEGFNDAQRKSNLK